MDKRRWRKLLVGEVSLRRVLLSLAFVYAALFVYAQMVVDGRMFFPPPSSYRDGGDIVKQAASDGAAISMRYLPNPAAEFTLLYSHGNAEDLGQVGFVLELYRDHGFSVLGYDYPGFGTSGGKPTERSTYRAIDAAYQYLVGPLKVPPERIILFGRSIGAGPSLWLAARRPVGGVVLESAFVSAFRVQTVLPLFPFDRYPNLARIHGLRRPLLVMHGGADDMIPIWHSEALYEAAPGPKLCLWVKGARHDDVPFVGGEYYWQTLERFAQRVQTCNEGGAGAH